MTNLQLYLAIGVPVVLNTLVLVALFTMLSARMTDGFAAVNQRMTDGFAALHRRIDDADRRTTDGFAAINQRFDDMRDLWHAELRRVEELLDARLTHLEDPRS